MDNFREFWRTVNFCFHHNLTRHLGQMRATLRVVITVRLGNSRYRGARGVIIRLLVVNPPLFASWKMIAPCAMWPTVLNAFRYDQCMQPCLTQKESLTSCSIVLKVMNYVIGVPMHMVTKDTLNL